ncbi:hypothetical protein M23134_05705 [Microscilla marina ATCC 23134]|uniref:Uncharacterized protein n=1 Tax=Microscilla marina ATCC 23134 TaxID=313606 RepID=A1ZIG4_MICM2|nr:hypothetical protein M23134_05705 [Microscilla marina ATCC 23134]
MDKNEHLQAQIKVEAKVFNLVKSETSHSVKSSRGFQTLQVFGYQRFTHKSIDYTTFCALNIHKISDFEVYRVVIMLFVVVGHSSCQYS